MMGTFQFLRESENFSDAAAAKTKTLLVAEVKGAVDIGEAEQKNALLLTEISSKVRHAGTCPMTERRRGN